MSERIPPYRPADMFGDPPKPKVGIGYAGVPGMGPSGETCGSCDFSSRNRTKFFKCHHELGYRSSSAASDIRLSMPACEYWVAKRSPETTG